MFKQTTVANVLGASALFATLAFALVLPAFATTPVVTPNWDTTGDYVFSMQYEGTDYEHDVTLIQDEDGDLTGNGGSPAGSNTYLWTITDGHVDDNTIEFTVDYTATEDATNPLTTMTVLGTIANNGTMSGTWVDNYTGANRAGTWSSVSGMADAYPTNDDDMVTVSIHKFVQGSQATAATADNADFPMTATWNAANTGAGTGAYALSETNTTPYKAVTTNMSTGANYETEELLNSSVVGAQCADGKPFALQAYTAGNTKAAAMVATPSMTKPSFTNLQQDKHVIVWNRDCSLPAEAVGGQIGGEVVDADVELEVTSIEMIDTTATANGSFASGWEYVFHITAPMSEADLSMKFDNWLRTGGAGTIPVANNMRISSLQADNAGATVLLTGANTYATPYLTMVQDLNPGLAGRQVQITVEVAVPNGTPNGSYTTAYGVQSNP